MQVVGCKSHQVRVGSIGTVGVMKVELGDMFLPAFHDHAHEASQDNGTDESSDQDGHDGAYTSTSTILSGRR